MGNGPFFNFKCYTYSRTNKLHLQQVMLQFLDDLIHQMMIPQHTWQMAMIMARVAPSLGKRVQHINMDSVAREKAH
jgi:hypothetical protein